jgi:hypothetical protein
MSEPRSFAYSLSQDEDGWRWCVYDEDGVTVADGALPSQAAAKAAVELALRRDCEGLVSST